MRSESRRKRRKGHKSGQGGSGVVLNATASAVMHRLVGLRTAAGSRPKTLRVRRAANISRRSRPMEMNDSASTDPTNHATLTLSLCSTVSKAASAHCD